MWQKTKLLISWAVDLRDAKKKFSNEAAQRL